MAIEPREIEYSFLGCIFDNPPERIAEALEEKANEEWFSDLNCKLVWHAIDTLRAKTPLDKITALTIVQTAINIAGKRKSRFHGQKITTAFLEEAQKYRKANQEEQSKTIAAYAPFLRDASIGRRLESAYESNRADGMVGSNAARAMAIVKQIQNIQQTESVDTDINVGDLLANMNASYEKAYEEFSVKHNYNYIPGIPFPWDNVSHLTKGLNPGLHIIAARPSVGKTSFVLQCMNYWCDLGYKVAFDCLDMSVTEMIKRPVANLAWVSPTRMEFGWASPEEQMRVREAQEHVNDWARKGLLTLTLEPDVDKLKSWAEIRHAAGKLDILVIDFAQRFRLKGASSEYEIVTYAAGVLKQLANECLIPVILLSQLSRDNVKAKDGERPPELSDLRGSGALEQDATSVVLLHKETAINNAWKTGAFPELLIPRGCDPKISNEIEDSIAAVCYNLAKNQNGPTGEVPFVVYQNCFRWYVGDKKAEKTEKYHKIQADWRFLEDPLVTAANNGAITYPNYWPQKCAETCGKLGIEIPPNIRDQLEKWDIDRYNALLAEHNKRMESAKESLGTPLISIKDSMPPPSMAKMVAEEHEKETQEDSPRVIEDTEPQGDSDTQMPEGDLDDELM